MLCPVGAMSAFNSTVLAVVIAMGTIGIGDVAVGAIAMRSATVFYAAICLS